jgi:hypothetical protein
MSVFLFVISTIGEIWSFFPHPSLKVRTGEAICSYLLLFKEKSKRIFTAIGAKKLCLTG